MLPSTRELAAALLGLPSIDGHDRERIKVGFCFQSLVLRLRLQAVASTVPLFRTRDKLPGTGLSYRSWLFPPTDSCKNDPVGVGTYPFSVKFSRARIIESRVVCQETRP